MAPVTAEPCSPWPHSAHPEPSPREFVDKAENRRAIFEDTFRDFERAYRESCLTKLIRKVKPDAVIDTVNTATGISYQDIFTSSFVVSRGLDELGNGTSELPSGFTTDVEKHLISAAVPQLILQTIATLAPVRIGDMSLRVRPCAPRNVD